MLLCHLLLLSSTKEFLFILRFWLFVEVILNNCANCALVPSHGHWGTFWLYISSLICRSHNIFEILSFAAICDTDALGLGQRASQWIFCSCCSRFEELVDLLWWCCEWQLVDVILDDVVAILALLDLARLVGRGAMCTTALLCILWEHFYFTPLMNFCPI